MAANTYAVKIPANVQVRIQAESKAMWNQRCTITDGNTSYTFEGVGEDAVMYFGGKESVTLQKRSSPYELGLKFEFSSNGGSQWQTVKLVRSEATDSIGGSYTVTFVTEDGGDGAAAKYDFNDTWIQFRVVTSKS